jgi:Mrp family chromosome partitioning ATPase
MIDVIPAGTISADSSVLSAAPALREEIEHFGRRYDTLIVSAPASRQGLIAAVAAAVPHSIVVARFGKTRISELRRLLGEAREAGTAIRGVVVWDREDPELLAPPDEEITSSSRQRVEASVS